MNETQPSIAVVVLNWNGKDRMKSCLDSLLAQTMDCAILIIDNGSVDGSVEYLRETYPDLVLIVNRKNLGFAGGVNCGIREAKRRGFNYVALLNNDAIADKDWLKHLARAIRDHPETGIVTCKLVDADNQHFDSTGDMYTIWGLPYPRGRGEPISARYDSQANVFAASGGASLYRMKMLDAIGLFDEDFFAYYEDVDIGFRAQLAGWRVRFVPEAIAYHQIGATSSTIKGFTTYQTIKNLPWLIIKNLPGEYSARVGIRFLLAYAMFVGKAVGRGHGWYAIKGFLACIQKLPKKWRQRSVIQVHRKVDNAYIWNSLTHDLPPNAKALRQLRAKWWQLTGRKRYVD